MEELISFKGMVDGVRINLHETAGIFDILAELEKQLTEKKAFFGDGDCHICFGGRHLSSGDKQRLEELLKRLMPMCRITFEPEKHTASQRDWISAYKGRTAEEHEAEKISKSMEEPVKDDFISVFRSNRARFYQGIVKEGMELRSDGHLILLGDVLKGGALSAVGNIIVIGTLFGTAHAGCNGHNGSYVLAMNMRPEGIAIADVGERYTYDYEKQEEEKPEEVKPTFFDKFKKKSEKPQITHEEQENRPLPAMALLKSNKIQYDNFSIQDFTNLKNMV